MKNIFSLFERPLKIQKNGVFLFEICKLISDDVILFAPKKSEILNKRYLWKY